MAASAGEYCPQDDGARRWDGSRGNNWSAQTAQTPPPPTREPNSYTWQHHQQAVQPMPFASQPQQVPFAAPSHRPPDQLQTTQYIAPQASFAYHQQSSTLGIGPGQPPPPFYFHDQQRDQALPMPMGPARPTVQGPPQLCCHQVSSYKIYGRKYSWSVLVCDCRLTARVFLSLFHSARQSVPNRCSHFAR